MANRPHLKLNTEKQADETEILKFHYGFGKEEEAPDEEPNYFPMATDFRRYLFFESMMFPFFMNGC